MRQRHRTGRVFAAVKLIISFALLTYFPVANVWAAPPPLEGVEAPAPKAPPSVVRELQSERTKTSRTFELSDGSKRTEFFAEQVHVKDPATGKFEDIDLSLVPSAVEPDALRTKRSEVVSLFRDRGPRAVKVKKGGFAAEIDLLDATEADPIDLGGKALYREVLPATDLLYEPRVDGVKETLVLDSALAPSTFRFFVALENLAVEQRDGGGATLVSSDGVVRALIDPLVVFDSSTDASGSPALCDEATMTVEAVPGGAYLTYDIPRDWLSAPERVFPVSVDPTMWFCEDNGANGGVLDTLIHSGQIGPTGAFYNHDYLSVGTNPANGWIYRSLLDFSIGNLVAKKDSIRVTDSTLSLYNFEAATTYSHTTYLRRISAAWTYQTWWGNRPASVPYAQQSVFGAASKWVNWDTESLVNQWLTGTPDYGVMLMQNDADSSNWFYRYRSSQYSTGSTYRPRLIVDYDEPKTTISDNQSAYRVGDLVTMTVKAETQDPDYVDQVRLNLKEGSTKYGELGWFQDESKVPSGWTMHGSPGVGLWASNDAAAAGTYKIEPVWGLASTARNAVGTSYRRATFAFRVLQAMGSVDDLDAETQWSVTKAPVFNTGLVTTQTNINIRPTLPQVRIETTASAGWFQESDANTDGVNDARNDSATSGRGSVKMSWDAVAGATGYKLYLFDGSQYRQIATLASSATSWSSAGKSLFPTDSWIEANKAALAAGTADPFATGVTTRELRDDPRPLYRATSGTTYDEVGGYFFKLVPDDGKAGTSDASTATEPIALTLDNRTLHLNDDPRHTSVDLGGTHGGTLSLEADTGAAELDAASSAPWRWRDRLRPSRTRVGTSIDSVWSRVRGPLLQDTRRSSPPALRVQHWPGPPATSWSSETMAGYFGTSPRQATR